MAEIRPYGRWWVEYWSRGECEWLRYPTPGAKGSPAYHVTIAEGGRLWVLDANFPYAENAIEAIVAKRNQDPTWRRMKHRVINDVDDAVAWSADPEYDVFEPTTQEDQVGTVSIEKQPLHVKRGDLIEAVKTRFAEEQKKREDAEAARSAARKEAEDAVASLSKDQLTNIVVEYIKCTGGSAHPNDVVKWVAEKQEKKAFVTKELAVTATETALEKWVRVLELASDEEIEIAPTDDVYLLL